MLVINNQGSSLMLRDLDTLYKAFLATILRDEEKRDDLLKELEETISN